MAQTQLSPDIRKLMVVAFSRLRDVETLCFDLRIDYDELPGDTLDSKIISLIEYVNQRSRAQELVEKLKTERPLIDWSEYLEVANTASGSAGAGQMVPHRTPWSMLGLLLFILAGLVLVFIWIQQPKPDTTITRGTTLPTVNTADVSTRNIVQNKEIATRTPTADVMSTQVLTKDVSVIDPNKASELAAQSLAEPIRNNIDLRLLLAVAAFRHGDSYAARNALLSALQYEPRLLAYMHGGNKQQVTEVAFSPDGATLAYASSDGAVTLWAMTDALSPPSKKILKVYSGVNGTAFSPDGKMLASANNDKTIVLWDVSNPQAAVRVGEPLRAHTGAVLKVGFSPANSKTLVSISEEDNSVIAWDTSTYPVSHTVLERRAITDTVLSQAFSPNGMLLALGSADGKITLWNLNRQPPQRIGKPLIGHSAAVQCLAFSPDGLTLASGGADYSIILWDVQKLQIVGRIDRGQGIGAVMSLAYNPNGNVLVSASYSPDQPRVRIWDVSKRQLPQLSSVQFHLDSNLIYSVAFSPDGHRLTAGGTENTVILWDTSNLQSLSPPAYLYKPITNTAPVTSLAFERDGGTLASGHEDGTLLLWNATNWELPKLAAKLPSGPTSPVMGLSFNSRGILASAPGESDNIIDLWDTKLRHQIAKLDEHSDLVTSVAFLPFSNVLASASVDTAVILRDVSDPQSPRLVGEPLRGHRDAVNSIAFSPDGKLLISGGADKTLRLWVLSDQRSPKRIGPPLEGHTDEVSSVAFSPDGKTVASGSWDSTIMLWDVSNPALPTQIGQPLRGHDPAVVVYSVAFSADGSMLASGGRDKIILWDVTNPHLPRQIGQALKLHTEAVSSVVFSPVGKTLVSGGRGLPTIVLWDVDPSSWAGHACRIANRQLTKDEWQIYVGDEPYSSVCPDLPQGN